MQIVINAARKILMMKMMMTMTMKVIPRVVMVLAMILAIPCIHKYKYAQNRIVLLY